MTISDHIRGHVHSSVGRMSFVNIARNDVYAAVAEFLELPHELSANLSPDERRMFCLFVAEALEQS